MFWSRDSGRPLADCQKLPVKWHMTSRRTPTTGGGISYTVQYSTVQYTAWHDGIIFVLRQKHPDLWRDNVGLSQMVIIEGIPYHFCTFDRNWSERGKIGATSSRIVSESTQPFPVKAIVRLNFAALQLWNMRKVGLTREHAWLMLVHCYGFDGQVLL